MKSSFYFKHDLDAREDNKMRSLIIKHGAAGYGIYWMVVEDLYRNKGRLTRDYPALSWAYHQPQLKVKSVVEEFDAFYDSRGRIACRRVDRGLAELADFREQAALAGRRGGLKRSLNARLKNPSGPFEKVKGRLTDSKQGEERRREERETGATPSLFQVQEFSKTVPGFLDPERFFDYYASTGWIVRGSPVVDWQALGRRWVKTDDKEKAMAAEESKKHRCQNREGCGLLGNVIAGKGVDGTLLCARCIEEEEVRIESESISMERK